jgi:hypothetical protein
MQVLPHQGDTRGRIDDNPLIKNAVQNLHRVNILEIARLHHDHDSILSAASGGQQLPHAN